MGRFDDEYRYNDQDRGYRSDEVRGPTREAWAGQPPPTREREETPADAGGYGNSRNPAWAGQSASLESDVAGRGMYGARGTEGTQGYGQYFEDGGEGGVPSSETRPSRDDRRRPRARHPRDEEFGARHWGRGEYQGEEPSRRSEHHDGVLEKIGRSVGRFFGVGPKGYRRSDDRIHEDVCETLQNHHDIDASEIEVTVKDGVVELSGTVDERRTRRMVEEVIERVPGIREIENHLRTKTYVARTEAADQMKLEQDANKPTLHS